MFAAVLNIVKKGPKVDDVPSKVRCRLLNPLSSTGPLTEVSNNVCLRVISFSEIATDLNPSLACVDGSALSWPAYKPYLAARHGDCWKPAG